jgi:exopolysaccharide production protein ExoQ
MDRLILQEGKFSKECDTQMNDSPIRAFSRPPISRRFAGPRINVDWCLAYIAMTGLEFIEYSQTIAAYSFVLTGVIYLIKQPSLTFDAFFRGGILWMYVALCFLSVFWAQDPSWAFRGSLQVALTVGIALGLARGLPPTSFMTALMAALFTATVASILDPQMAYNAGVLGLIGIFGSKNQFGLAEALFFMVCAWIAFDKDRSLWIRRLAWIGLLSASYFIVAARSVDASLVAVGAIGCGIVGLRLNWFPPGSRMAVLCGAVVVVSLCFAMLFLVADNLSGSLLGAVGKDATLTGRTEIWAQARVAWSENPIIGVGYQQFWVFGNPFAEEIWRRFQPGRSGFNFHNIWYEMGVQFGYIGWALMVWLVASANVQVLRWVTRAPTMSSCFFLSFIVFIDIRTFVESELLGQFSLTTVLFVATWSYARQANRGARKLRSPSRLRPLYGTAGASSQLRNRWT